jgi:hypothetical protein
VNIHLSLGILTAALVILAGYYAWKCLRTLYRTGPQFEMLPDDRRFLRQQAWRRLINSGLTLILASLLAAPFLTGLQTRAEQLGDEREQLRNEGRSAPFSPEQREFVRFYAGYWIIFLILLGAILAVAGVDVFATRRFAMTQMRRIQADRRAMLERQLERLREERRGEDWSDS